MRPIFFTIAFLFLNLLSFSQNTIEGDRLLDLVSKPITDPLAVQLKQQESFLTDAWSSGFTVYLTRDNGVITEVELENGKLRYGSQTERYGYYPRKLPLALNWNMTETDLSNKLGKPVIVSERMNFKDYRSGKWSLRVFFENNKIVSVSYKLTDPSVTATTTTTSPVNNPAAGAPAKSSMQPSWIIKVDNDGNAQVSWTALKQIILSVANLKSFAGNDSVDYIGQVYYNTDWKVDGFKRSAIKRRKKQGDWYYEAFFKTEAGVDSEYVRKLFFSLYDNIKKTIKDNTGDDFILAAVARQPISHSPVNWIAQWSLSTSYKTLPAGLPKFRIAIMVSGMTNVFKDNKMEYTFKVYVNTGDLEMDFFTWDKPV